MGRALTVNEFGVLNLALPIQFTIIMMTSIGIAPSIARFTARHLGRNERNKLAELYSSTLFYYVIGATVLGIIVFFSSNWLAYSFFNVPELSLIIKITAFGIPFGVFVSVFTGFFQGFKKMDKMSYTILASQIFRVASAAVFVWLGYKVVGAILGSSLAFVFGVMIGYLFFRKLDIKYTKAKFETFYEVFKFSIPTSISGLATVIFAFTDIFLIGKLMTPTAVGIYAAASPTARLTIAVAIAISATILPIVAEKRARNNEEKIKHHTYQSLFYFVLAAIPLMVVLWLAAPWILGTLFGPSYIAGLFAFRILVIGAFFISIHVVLAGSFQGIGWPSIPMYVIVTAAIVNLILNFWLIPLRGIEGAAIATTISSVIGGLASLGIFMVIRNKA
jgi:stage V sporulation protein B|tara:strand:- start:625 stop:1794 length:1170 start_codon:yes stop_codon:yes gene_type:complete